MLTIDKRITTFIQKHHVLNLATCIENIPYIAACFYVFDMEMGAFIFSSDLKTTHAQQMQVNCKVSASIALETKIIGKIQGLQITGEAVLLAGDSLKKANNSYLKKYPFAILADTTLWALYPNFMKLTDNKLGFGKKLLWEKK